MARRREAIVCGVHETQLGATHLRRGRSTLTVNGINELTANACDGIDWLDAHNRDAIAPPTVLETVAHFRFSEHDRQGCARTFSDSTGPMSGSVSRPRTRRPASDLLNPESRISSHQPLPHTAACPGKIVPQRVGRITGFALANGTLRVPVGLNRPLPIKPSPFSFRGNTGTDNYRFNVCSLREGHLNTSWTYRDPSFVLFPLVQL